jgi:hypothetical protein
MSRTDDHAQQIDRLASAPATEPSPFAAFGMPGLGAPPAPDPQPILELTGHDREDELDSLTDWVDDFLLPTYGAEVTTASPWCLQWQEHDDVVAWLHALWLSYQQHREPDAGLAGMLVWHRDYLLHTMAAVRAPGGPLSACMTSPDRPAHRLLAPPPSSVRATTSTGPGTDEEPDDGDAETAS